MSTAKANLIAAIEAAGITLTSVFVPFSASRNAKEKSPSLNWKVTLHKNGRAILTTDFMAGSAHCPGYNKRMPTNWNRPPRYWQDAITGWECENGKPAEMTWSHDFRAVSKAPIEPDIANVIHCLISDASVLDSGGFEDWASELGYDPDSRNAEKIYRECLEAALKLRSGLGEQTLSALAEAGQDY